MRLTELLWNLYVIISILSLPALAYYFYTLNIPL
jgi:hypothetical protein